jgi:transcriptional regulator with XRE-family HTH domain
MEKFSNALRQAIVDSGMTRYRLAQRSGLTEPALSRFVRSKRKLSLDSVDRLMETLELEIRPRRRKRKDS